MEQLVQAIERADLTAVREFVKQPFNPDYKVTVTVGSKEKTLYLDELVEQVRLAKERAIIARGTQATAEEIRFIVDNRRILGVLLKHGVPLGVANDEDYENFMNNPLLKKARETWLRESE